MNAKDALAGLLKFDLVSMTVGDLSDADLLVRPVPEANHIAWQLGHVISSEVYMLSLNIPGIKYPPLPAGFDAQHKGANSKSDTGFATKAEYLALYAQVRAATIAALLRLPEADLDKPSTGPVAQMAPTIGALFGLCANHATMHAGQFSVVRRKLGKPVLF